jgi:mannitol 2-dehydrogenase
MVDRITPVTSAADRALVRERCGWDDAWPVPAEPFVQWVVEDHFAAGRPPLERVGVQFVEDVAPYEKMKLRLLNCSHQALGYFGVLLGYRYVHEAAADPDIVKLLQDYMDLEATPTLDPVPGVDLAHYKATLIARFQNEAIGDTLARICAFSSDRIGKWLLPVVRDQLRNGGPVARCAAVVASWARYLEAGDATGQPHSVVDQLKDELVPLADQRQNSAAAFLAHPLFEGLDGEPRFAAAFLSARQRIDAEGPRAALRHFD